MKIKKFFLSFFVLLLALFLSVNTCLATSTPSGGSFSGRIGGQTDIFQQEAGFSSTAQAENIVASIIQVVLSLLGIIFVILMIFSGYQWMTAGGNEDMVKKAKSRIMNAVIGLIIIIMAYAITAFIFSRLPGGPSGTPGGGTGTTIIP